MQTVQTRDDLPWEPGSETYYACKYLGETIWDAMQPVVGRAVEAMEWLQQAADAASDEGLPITWTAPSGFPVLQANVKFAAKRIRTSVGDRTYRITRSVPSKRLDTRAQRSGIAPNFVHSMDASALVISLARLCDRGVSFVSAVHDDYAVLAPDVVDLNQALRDAHVQMYEGRNYLDEFRAEIETQIEGELPEPPAQGDLDLRCVLDSEYFFH
jgi:DNA-directed RNA polymerase